MGKRSNHKRTLRHHARRERVMLAKIADLKGSVALHAAGMDSAQARADRLEGQLRRMIEAIRQVDPACIALDVERSVPWQPFGLRVPINQHVSARADFYDAASTCQAAPIEHLTNLVLCDADLQGSLQKALHFHIQHPPGQPSFIRGYAVSHYALKCWRHPEDLTRMICREFGAAIHEQLWKK